MRPVRVALPQRAGDVGEPGADGEHLDPAPAGPRRTGAPAAAARRRTRSSSRDTSTSSTTRRGRVRAPPGDVAGLAHPAQLVAQRARGVDVGRGASAGAAPYAAWARRVAGSRTSRRAVASRRREVGHVAVPQHLGRAGRGAEHLVVLVGVSPSPGALGARAARSPRGRRSRGRGGAGSPSRGVEPRLEDLVVAGQVVGPGAQRGAAGPVGRRAGRRARPGRAASRKPWARSWVTGTPAARSARVKPRSTGTASPDRRAGSRSHVRSRREHPVQRLAHPLGVLAVLHQRARGWRRRSRGRARWCRGGAAPAPSRGSRRPRAA